jgi:hypothetical protein
MKYCLAGLFWVIAFSASAQVFKIQIAAYADSVPGIHFTDRGIEGVTVERTSDGLWRYFIGYYYTRTEAESIQEQLIDRGFPRPVIIDMAVEEALSERNCGYTSGFAQAPDELPGPVYIVFFDDAKSVLDDRDRKMLDKVYAELKSDAKKELIIMGFTDNKGAAEDNMELSSQRARAVRNYFINKGVNALRLFVESYGESEPWYPNRDAQGNELPQNQRWNNRVMMKYKEQQQ